MFVSVGAGGEQRGESGGSADMERQSLMQLRLTALVQQVSK